MVVKKNGQRERFLRSKVARGIMRACEKRPVSLEQIETIVEGIEYEIASGGAREVTTETVGQLVMARLRVIDDVAYVRFASVYQSFSSLDEFMAVLRSLQADKDEEH